MLGLWVQPLTTKCKSNKTSENPSEEEASGRLTVADPPVAITNLCDVQGPSGRKEEVDDTLTPRCHPRGQDKVKESMQTSMGRTAPILNTPTLVAFLLTYLSCKI